MNKSEIKATNIGVVGDHTHVQQIDQLAEKRPPNGSGGGRGSHFVLIAVLCLTLFVGTIVLAFFNQIIATFAFGIVFIVAMTVLAFAFPNPTAIQYLVMRIVLALSSAGVAGMLTGFIAVEIPSIAGAAPLVKAGGALAVFVIVYFRSPADLVVVPKSSPR